jgi:hypothetical protein
MSDHAALLPRYRHLREVARKLAATLTSRLGKDVIDEGGRKLGILRQGVLVFEAEAEMAVLMDYCIHDVRRQGQSAVERYLAEAPFPPDSDEMLLLQAHARAIYSLFLVEGVEPGVGVRVRDLFRSQEHFLHDVGFSQTVERGAVLAGRIVSAGDVTMTTGAVLPFAQVPEAQLADFVSGYLPKFKAISSAPSSPEGSSELATMLIQTSLQGGGADHVRYEDSFAGPRSARLPAAPSRPRLIGRPSAARPGRVGRNDPCPCGSGKKFKNCCYGRR